MGRRILWAAALALLCVICETEGINAGLKGRITANRLEYMGQLGVDILKSYVRKMTIPDISGEQSAFLIGTIKYTLSGIQIQDIQLPNSAVKFIPGVGIGLSISDASIKINGSWKLSYWFSDSGSVDVSGSGMSISSVVRLTGDAAGHLSISAAACTASIGAIDLTLFGGTSWLYNLFKGMVQKQAQSLFSSKVCPLVSMSIKDLDQKLKTMKVSHQIDQLSGIDFALVNPPQITDQYIEGDFKGEFYSVKNPSAPPFSPAPFFLPDQSSQMVYFGISEFLANSAAHVYFTSGNLHINLTDSMIPQDSPIHLTTDSFKDLIPEVARRFPHLPITLQISATKRPIVTCLPGDMDLTASGILQAFAMHANASMSPLFQLNMDVVIEGRLMFTGAKLSASLDLKSFTLSMAHSDVGPFQVNSLQEVLNGVLRKVALPTVNGLLSGGFPLPTLEGLTLINPVITINQGYVLVGTDVQLTM